MVYIETYKTEIKDLLSVLLPSLAAGFFLQRGHVFGFGYFDPSNKMLVTRYPTKVLNQTPKHNLDAERSVASINYGLKIHGATSDRHGKGMSYDLIETKPREEYKKFHKVKEKVNDVVSVCYFCK